MDFWFMLNAIILIAIFLFGSTYILKRFPGVETHYVYSIWYSKRFKRLIERAKFLQQPIEFIAKLGLIVGFGIFASDFLFGKGKSIAQRLVIAAITSIALFALYTATFAYPFSIAPITKDYASLFAFAFSFFGIAIFGTLLLLVNSFHIIQNVFVGKAACPGVAPLIPGVKIPKVPIFIPWYGWLALALAIVAHEGAHGIMLLKKKLKFKSAGIILLGLFPLGAFVKPDEEELERTRPIKALLVYSAGPAANLAATVLFWFLGIAFFSAFYYPMMEDYKQAYISLVEKVVIESVDERLPYCGNPKAPAYGILKPGMEIIAVDGTRIRSTLDLKEVLAKNPFKEKVFEVRDTDGSIKRFKLKPDPELGRFGINVRDVLREGAKIDERLKQALIIIANIYGFILICFLLSLALALFNLLPITPLDGGRIASILYFGKLSAKKRKKVEEALLYFFLAIMFVNILPFFV